MDRVSFTQMKDGTKQDYELLNDRAMDDAKQTADRLLEALVTLDSEMAGYQVTRLGHSLQTATRAWRDGADTDWIAAALLHDIGDIFAPYNHDEYAATILRPFIREQCAWAVQTHGDFQMLCYGHHLEGFDQHKRERHRGHPYFDDTAEFCERWDQASFDPDYDNLPLKFFAPMVREVFDREAYGLDVIQPGVRVPLVQPDIAKHRAV